MSFTTSSPSFHQPAAGMTCVYNIFACGHFTSESVPDCGEPYVFAFNEATCGTNSVCNSTDPTWYADKLRAMGIHGYDGPEALNARVATIHADAKQALADLRSIGPFTADEIKSTAATGPIADLLMTNEGDRKAALNNLLGLPFLHYLRNHIKSFASRQKHQVFLVVCCYLAARAAADARSTVQGLQDSVGRLHRMAMLQKTFALSNRTFTDHEPALAGELAALKNAGSEGEAVLNRPITPTAFAEAEALRDRVLDTVVSASLRVKSGSCAKPRNILDEVSAMLATCQYDHVSDFAVRRELRATSSQTLNRPASNGLRISMTRITKPTHL